MPYVDEVCNLMFHPSLVLRIIMHISFDAHYEFIFCFE